MPRENWEKIKKIMRSQLGEQIIFVAMAAFSLLLTIITYSIKLNAGMDADYKPSTLWNASYISTPSYFLRGVNVYLVIAFFIGLALTVAAAVVGFVKRKKTMYFVSTAYNFVLDVVLLVFHLVFSVFKTSAVVFIFLHVFVSALMVAILLWRRVNNAEDLRESEAETETEVELPTEEEISVLSPISAKAGCIAMLVCECIATFAMFSTLFIPVYVSGATSQTYVLIQTVANSSMPLYFHIAFLAVFIGCIVGSLSFISTIAYFKKRAFYKKSKAYVYGVTFFTLAFFVVGYVLTLVRNSVLGVSAENAGVTLSYIPVILAMLSLLAHSVVYGKCATDIDEQKTAKPIRLKVEPLIYVVLMTVGLFVSLLLNIVGVVSAVGSFQMEPVNLTGYDLLTKYADLAGGFQLVAFILIAILITSSVLMLMSLCSLVAKNKDYYALVKTTAFTNLGFALLVGLFGVYFKVAQQINEENIHSLLALYGLENYIDYSYELKSQSFIVLVICAVVFAIMLFRKQFNLVVPQTEFEMTIKNPQDAQTAATSAAQLANGEQPSNAKSAAGFDACPAFTELDGKLPQIKAELAAKRQQLFQNFTLPNLVRFVVDYARESRLHLSYSLEDIATFVAGLGASRLTILQGMSGTGKTSLPKIFSEAIMGACEIVEVESSWRDKYELLGYYNEFSKSFTPKKFTQCLYKARLNSSVLTLIVLDEMNLSRIEYYFSDFLSLMENEPDKREIKLLNVKLFRNGNGEQISYKGLTDGHTIKIPQNVWFVGTANRDESTFAISDKVYDRAQTMNFNKRAPKIHSFSQPLEQRFVSYDMFLDLCEEAKATVLFDVEENLIVQKVEKILAPYNISFGNRILNQMEDFVKIYCACFGDRDAVLKEAVEKILLSKVVSKLENKVVENKEALAKEFERLGLVACSDFVRKLNED